jgi:DNA-binding transcriptional regulator YiaG
MSKMTTISAQTFSTRPATPDEAMAVEDKTPQETAKVPAPQVKAIRRALGLTQEEFAVRYLIPLGTLRDWEQGRTKPDRPARAYIKVIATDPDWVSRALGNAPVTPVLPPGLHGVQD